MKILIALVALAAVAPAYADSVSRVHTYRPAGQEADWQILVRADVGFIRDMLSVHINGETVIEEMRLGEFNPSNVGQGVFGGVPVTAECQLTIVPGAVAYGHRCVILAGNERAAIIEF